MKRLLGLVVLFVVLSVSVPSYGVLALPNYFLIFNVSCTVQGVNNNAKASIPWKAYLVLNFNGSDDFVDANLIMYGTDSNTPKKQKVYVQLNYTGSTPRLSTNLWSQDSFVILDFWDYTDPFDFGGQVVGKMALKDIGLGATSKKWVASSLTGPMMVLDGMLFDPNDRIAGGGIISMSYYSAATKAVNTYGLTQDQIIVTGYLTYKGILQTLQAKGYVAATLP